MNHGLARSATDGARVTEEKAEPGSAAEATCADVAEGRVPSGGTVATRTPPTHAAIGTGEASVSGTEGRVKSGDSLHSVAAVAAIAAE